MPEKPSPLEAIAQDISRHVMGGARNRRDEDKKSQPVWILTGQQKPATLDQMSKKDVIFYNGGTAEFRFPNHKAMAVSTYKKVEQTFLKEGYYDVTEDTTLPHWLFALKTLALPENPAPEDFLVDEGVKVLHLPPAILREAEFSRTWRLDPQKPPIGDPRVTLCSIRPDNEHPEVLTPEALPRALWSPALLLRCGMTSAAPRDDKTKPVFEIKGIPQGERTYLDALKLLEGGSIPANSELKLFIQYRVAKKPLQTPVQIDKWTLTRRNLTGLARPANLLKTTTVADLPYIATQANKEDTLRLLEMASITNTGGYFLRADGHAVDTSAEEITLVIVLITARAAAAVAEDSREARKLPSYANAIAFDTKMEGDVEAKGGKEKKEGKRAKGGEVATPADALRFEGSEEDGPQFKKCIHVNIQPYVQPGCLSLGMIRTMSWAAPTEAKPHDVTDEQGFAESVHLADVEVTNQYGNLEMHWSEDRTAKVQTDGVVWKGTPCAGDVTPPLFPKEKGEGSEETRIAALSPERGKVSALCLNPWPEDAKARWKADEDSHSHYYRTIIRYDYENVFQRLADPKKRTLTVRSRLRDLYGNRVLPNRGAGCEFKRTLFYSDPIIQSSEWPGFEFCVYASGVGEFTLRARYSKPDNIKFHLGHIVDLKEFADRVRQKDAHDTLMQYLSRRISTGGIGAIQTAAADGEPERCNESLVAELNRLVDGPSMYEKGRFHGVKLRPQTAHLASHAAQLQGDSLRRLNRMLLEDAFPEMLVMAEEDNKEELLRQHLRKLQLIRDQLTGANDEVAVEVVDWQEGSTPNFEITERGDLRKNLLEYLGYIISHRGDPRPKPVFTQFTLAVAKGKAGPLRFLPALQIRRKDDCPYLPSDHELPKDDDVLKKVILDQIKQARSLLPLTLLPPDPQQAPPTAEFVEIARAFNVVGGGLECRIAMARNRFNEHELWFVPRAALPKAAAISAPVYSTARPLSNKLGYGKFQLPDFKGSAKAADDWNGFPVPADPVTVSGVDYDDIGREFTVFLEGLLASPLVITEAGRVAEWRDFLKKKDALATRLAEKDVVTPLWAKDGERPEPIPAPNAAGVQRMAVDAFQRDLRSFYGVDTIVGLPFETVPEPGGINNYYGKVRASFDFGETPPTGMPAFPKVSDFVLSGIPEQNAANPDVSYITVTYDLPPGEESNWRDWKAKSIEATITHVQLPVGDQPTSHPFDQGFWLELVSPDKQEELLTWHSLYPIPALVRRYPEQPVLVSVTPRAEATMVATPRQFDRFARWAWQVDFTGKYESKGGKNNQGTEGEYGENDTVFLDVAYREEDISSKLLADAEPRTWPPDSLLHFLMIARGVIPVFPDWFKNEPAKALKAITKLVEEVTNRLGSAKSQALAADPEVRWDRFKLEIGKPGTVNNSANEFVKTVIFQNDPDNARNYQIIAMPETRSAGLPIRLFGAPGFNPVNLQPELSLKRNLNLPADVGIPDVVTNPALVYACGPVKWPQAMPVTNRLNNGVIEVNKTGMMSLVGVVSEILQAVCVNPDLGKLRIRVAPKHAHGVHPKYSGRGNNFSFFAVDYDYQQPGMAAERIVQSYEDWLKASGINAAVLLESIAKPRFQFSIQVAKPDPANADNPGRVLLEIETVSVDLDGLKLKD